MPHYLGGQPPMNRTFLPIFAALALAACHHAAPQEQSAKDERAVAMVERAQHALPPMERIRPEPVSFADLRRPGVSVSAPHDAPMPAPGAGCHFREREDGPALLAATSEFALARFDGQFEIFAADSGGPMLSGGLRRDYSSGAHSILLDEAPDGPATTMTIRDRFDRPIYTATGEWRCTDTAEATATSTK
jgi:hypothetical protein